LSRPFIIWTMRRTGGTTLADTLMTLSEHPRVKHEPFNEDRIFGAVATGWYKNHDRVQTRADLLDVLTGRPLIKHCFEIHERPFNRLILNVTNRLGYAQMLLTREDEVARILSLELAKSTGVWGKMGSERGYAKVREGEAGEIRFDIDAARRHLEKCFSDWAWLAEQMAEIGVTPHQLRFEELYTSVDEGRAAVGRALDFLGFPPGTLEAHRREVDNAIHHRGQNSAAMLSYVANIDETRTALATRLAELRQAAPG
jgi:hypothetical protein